MKSRNRWKLPDLGIGVGLRTPHFAHILAREPDVDWFEILSENFMHTGGRPMQVLDQIAARYKIVMHGVSMSIGTTDAIDWQYMRELRELAERVHAVWLGDHVCWTGVAGRNNHDLLPMPYTEASLKHLVARIRAVQDFFGRPLVLENPSTYLTFASSNIPEHEFLARMAEDSDCALLVDVNNVYVTCRNHDLDPHAWLAGMPWERVVQIHIAGHTDHGTHCIDTHIGPVPDPVWELYAEAIRLGGSRATLLEWDEHIPDFATVHRDAKRAERFRRRAVGAAR
jgi:uncharacterized protein (UPF0276 family)